MAKFVEELQERMERMEKEMGDLREENRSYKRRYVTGSGHWTLVQGTQRQEGPKR